MSGIELHRLLSEAISGNATAIRVTTRLQPTGGQGDKVFPPTYPTDDNEIVYATEERLIDGERVRCVLLDSVQSQANRMESALQEAIDAGTLTLPLIETMIKGYGRVTVLQAPHRLYDSILRDSELDGVRFWHSELGHRLMAARLQSATALYEYCPQMLLFGGWHSQAESGGRGAKIPRALVSEIIGLNVQEGIRPASRVDPLGVGLDAGPVYRAADANRQWTLEPEAARKNEKGEAERYGEGKPSNIGHGNIKPSLTLGGVTLAEARQVAVLSLPALRRLHFPDPAGRTDSARDQAGRTVVAALALCALALQIEQGFDLRSRCLLVPVGLPRFELLGRTLEEVQTLPVDAALARETLLAAVEAAQAQDLRFVTEPARLQASADLNQLVQRSLASHAAAE